MTFERENLVLAVLSTSNGDPWTPTQVQKIFFLLDRKIPDEVGGPHWNFTPFDYGPYDPEVYRQLEQLAQGGYVLIVLSEEGIRNHFLTPKGQARGETQLLALPERARNYIQRLSQWLRPLLFQQLVAAVCKDFPEMCGGTVFKGSDGLEVPE